MTHSEAIPRAKALFDELLFVADEYITTDVAALLAKELHLDTYDPTDYDH